MASLPTPNRYIRYNEDWEELPECRGWLARNRTNDDQEQREHGAYCKVCESQLRCHLGDLKKHGTGETPTDDVYGAKVFIAGPRHLAMLKALGMDPPDLPDELALNEPLEPGKEPLEPGKMRLHYRREWENLPECNGWLMKNPNPSGHKAFCKLCQKAVRCHLNDVKRHGMGVKHMARAAKAGLQTYPDFKEESSNDNDFEMEYEEEEFSNSLPLVKQEAYEEEDYVEDYNMMQENMEPMEYMACEEDAKQSSNYTAKLHYREKWEALPELKDWLAKFDGQTEDGIDRAYCLLCQTDIRCHLSDLRKHGMGKKESLRETLSQRLFSGQACFIARDGQNGGQAAFKAADEEGRYDQYCAELKTAAVAQVGRVAVAFRSGSLILGWHADVHQPGSSGQPEPNDKGGLASRPGAHGRSDPALLRH